MSARDVIALQVCCNGDCINAGQPSCFGIRHAAASANRILTALAAAGYAVVPVEPTDAMCMAGEECIVCSEGCLLAEDVYFAMLAADKEPQA